MTAAGELRRKIVKAATLLRTPRFRRALAFGVAAAIEHVPLLRGLNEPAAMRTVVDVGANKGQFALLALALFPQARVYAFEPLAAPFARMQAWSRHETRLDLQRLALADVAGPRMMHVSARMDNSSLRAITGRQTAQFPGTHCVGAAAVTAARLDDLLSAADLPAPALLKIDVQGGELDVLRGAVGLLACFDWVYVECSFIEFYEGQGLADDIAGFLAAAGFRPTACSAPQRDAAGRPVQADVLFARGAPCAGPSTDLNGHVQMPLV